MVFNPMPPPPPPRPKFGSICYDDVVDIAKSSGFCYLGMEKIVVRVIKINIRDSTATVIIDGIEVSGVIADHLSPMSPQDVVKWRLKNKDGK